MPKTDFSATEVARITGVNYQTLNRWLNEGVITCDVPAEGTGSRRRFTATDVVFVTLARALMDHAVPSSAVALMMQVIRDRWTGEDPAQAGWLIVKSWTGGRNISATYVPTRPGVEDLLGPGPVSGPVAGEWTGILLVIDIGHFARLAYDQLATLRQKAAR